MASTIPFIPADQRLPEITFKAIILSIILTIILSASNTYLALKVGLLTSASIPAAIISMGILRLFKRSNILENNIVQTCASAGEAVAGGIVYPLPALIMMRFWEHIPYWETFLIALLSGTLGVMFTVPIRRLLLNDPNLRFPEGRAIAAILMAQSSSKESFRAILMGSGLGALIEFAQSGLKLLSDNWQVWFVKGKTILGFGVGFSSTLIGAGYLIGFNLGFSIFFGTLLSWLIAVPIASHFYPVNLAGDLTLQASDLWGSHIRFIGLGNLLIAGLWTLYILLRGLYKNVQHSPAISLTLTNSRLRTEHDFSLRWVAAVILLIAIFLYFLFSIHLPLNLMLLPATWHFSFIVGAIVYLLIAGFMITTLCGYFSGMIGVSATPGSAVIIVGMLGVAILIRFILPNASAINSYQAHFAAATTIIIGTVIAGATAITNDNIQDLKVGQIVGATPWKQQAMLLLGVFIGALVIPPIMEALFNVYGIGNVVPRPNMNPTETLPAPAGAMFAALSQAVFTNSVQWNMLFIGFGVGISIIILNLILKKFNHHISPLGVATGMYVPLTTSTPLFIGSVMALVVEYRLRKKGLSEQQQHSLLQNRLAIACGLVAGSALINVILAIPFAMTENSNLLRIVPATFTNWSTLLGIIVTLLLCWYLGWYRLEGRNT